MRKGSDASKPELYARNERIKADAQGLYQILLRAEILPARKAGMREKESQREEGKGGGNVLWQKMTIFGTADIPKEQKQWRVPGGLQGRSWRLLSTKPVPLWWFPLHLPCNEERGSWADKQLKWLQEKLQILLRAEKWKCLEDGSPTADGHLVAMLDGTGLLVPSPLTHGLLQSKKIQSKFKPENSRSSLKLIHSKVFLN